MRLASSVVSSVLTVASIASVASAEPREHDGLHLSGALGGALLLGEANEPRGPGDVEVTLNGPGVAAHLLVGGTPVRGLALGGGLVGAHMFKPKREIENVEVPLDGDVAVATTGLYADYYPWSNRGLHFLLLLGLGTMEDGNDQTDGIATGFGGVIGAGYDFWISDELSVGFLARMQVVTPATTLTAGPVENSYEYTLMVPALVATIAFH